MRKQIKQPTTEERSERLLSLMKEKNKIKIAVEDFCGEYNNGEPTIEIYEIDSEILKQIYDRKPIDSLLFSRNLPLFQFCDVLDSLAQHAKVISQS